MPAWISSVKEKRQQAANIKVDLNSSDVVRTEDKSLVEVAAKGGATSSLLPFFHHFFVLMSLISKDMKDQMIFSVIEVMDLLLTT